MTWEFERVAGSFDFTEGPVWDGETVLFSDMPSATFRRYDPESGECTVFAAETGAANGLKFDDRGRLYACEMVGRRVVRYADEGREAAADRFEGARFNSPNDLAIRGDSLWFTDPYYATDWEPEDKALDLEHRSVYRVDLADGNRLARVTDDTTQPNGILVSPSGETLYVAQSDYDGPAELRAYPLREDGSTGEHTVLHNFAPHRGIDGMCLDEDGNVVATAGSAESGPGPMLYVFTPAGRVLETHPVPDLLPTNCAFGGPDLDVLYLTGGDSCLYRAETDRRGFPGAPETVAI